MGTLVKPFVFAAGAPAVGGQVNGDFDAIFTWINTGGAMWSDASVAFTNTPAGPNSDPTSANQLARKAYVDAKVTASGVSHLGLWGATNLLVQAGVSSVTTDVNGVFNITIPTPFPNSLVTNIQLLGQSNQGFTDYQVLISSASSRTTLQGRVAKLDVGGVGAGFNAGTFLINWIAVGT